jgi:hypothetical protein
VGEVCFSKSTTSAITYDEQGKGEVSKISSCYSQPIKAFIVFVFRQEIVRLIMVPVTPAQQSYGRAFLSTRMADAPNNTTHQTAVPPAFAKLLTAVLSIPVAPNNPNR